jgi:hypothetical protein
MNGSAGASIADAIGSGYCEAMKRHILFGSFGRGALILACAVVSTASQQAPATTPTPITVYKTASCGCCAKWVDHMKSAGFAPTVSDLPEVGSTKLKLGVPADLQSCHTATVDGYVVEGHVPADVVRQLLKEKPKVTGIAVPGMPMGSPGMEQGGMKDAYEVLTFDRSGKTTVYAKR